MMPKQLVLTSLAAALLATAGCAPATPAAVPPGGGPALAATAAVAAPTAATPAAAPAIAPLVMRKAAPVARFKDAAGQEHALDEWKGRFVVLMFFSVTCAVCQKEVPKMQAFAARYGPEATVIPVEATGASAADVAAFAATYKVAMPLYHDPSRAAPNAYLVKFFPTGYIVSPDFVVQEDVRGAAAQSYYETRLGLYAPDVYKAATAPTGP